jgi:hypothetical protein
MSMSVFSGQFISRTGRYKVWPVIGISLMIVGSALLSRLDVATPYWRTTVVMLVFGWGLGAVMQPLTLAVQNAMPPQDMGVATASATFFRQMGGTLGTAVFLSVLFDQLGGRVADNLRAASATPQFRGAVTDPGVAANPANAPVLDALKGRAELSLDDSSFLSSADPVVSRPILDGFAESMSVVFLAASAVLVIGLVAVVTLKEVPLRTQSGIDARRGKGTPPVAALGPSATPVVLPADAANPDGARAARDRH